MQGSTPVPSALSRSGLDGLVARAKELGASGLVWMVVEEGGGVRSPVSKFLAEREIEGVIGALEAVEGDTLLLVADVKQRRAQDVLGQLRIELGRPEGHDDLSFLWVTDFPAFEETAGGQLVPSHHPFTAPVDVAAMEERPAEAMSRAYDLVVNGIELGSGSIRIHDPEVQRRVFEILGHLGRAGGKPFRVVSSGASIWHPTSWWVRLRDRPPGCGVARRAQHPRGDAVPQDPDRFRSPHRGSDPGRGGATRRTGRQAVANGGDVTE